MTYEVGQSAVVVHPVEENRWAERISEPVVTHATVVGWVGLQSAALGCVLCEAAVLRRAARDGRRGLSTLEGEVDDDWVEVVERDVSFRRNVLAVRLVHLQHRKRTGP